MSSATVEIITAIVTFIMSVSISAFIAGTRWGRVEADIKVMSDRLAKIEGMFTLRLRDPSDGGK